MAEAHAELARILPRDVLKQIDAMESEEEMVEFHFGLGMGIRNDWGLWRGSALQQHMRDLGFSHPDDMSSVILETFWRQRHGEPLRLEERAAEYAAYWEEARRADVAEEERATAARQKMQTMMMGLTLDTSGAAPIRMPDEARNSIRARFLAPYRGGVLLAVREYVGKDYDEFVTVPYYLSPVDRSIHPVEVRELQRINSVVAAAETVWISGIANGKSAILELSADGNRRLLDLPEQSLPPQLGLHGNSPLAVYPRSVYERTGSGWNTLYRGEIQIPWSGPPPRLIGDRLFLRDEGRHENGKQLWWLTLGSAPRIVSLEKDTGLVGRGGPRWENSSSYAVSSSGDLWATVGEGSQPQSLLRKDRDGGYAIAIMNNALKFMPDWFSSPADGGVNVSAVAELDDGSILLVGKSGLYRLEERELRQLLRFTNYVGADARRWEWDPGNILVRGPDSYLVSGTFGGVYLLERADDGQWTADLLDDRLGGTIRW